MSRPGRVSRTTTELSRAEVLTISVLTWLEYLSSYLPSGTSIGIDPALLAVSDYKLLSDDLSRRGLLLKPLVHNLVDEVWQDVSSEEAQSRPPPSRREIFVQPLRFAGKSIAEKVAEVRGEVQKLCEQHSADGLRLAGFVATMLDEVAWLVNLRGSDVPYNPVFFAFALVPLPEKGPVTLYAQGDQLTPDAKEQLQDAGVIIKPYQSFYEDLHLIGNSLSEGEKYLIGKRASLAVASALGGMSKVHVDRSPVIDLKSIKNEVELDGFRHSHLLDGAALANYFAWLESQLAAGNPVTEFEGSEKLHACRAAMQGFKGDSFTTISSTGPNAAIIHYSPPPTGSDVIDKEKVYLCDSGAQFVDGTTDV